MHLPLRLRDTHQKFLVLDRDPAGENLHRVLEIRVEEDVPGTVDQGGRGSVQDVETTVIGGVVVDDDAVVQGSGWTGRERVDVWVSQEHEDVPDA